MDIESIVREIDAQISRLQQARALLAVDAGSSSVIRKRGRPKGSANKAGKPAKAKRKLSQVPKDVKPSPTQ